MKLNKPKYSLRKNFIYALEGLIEITKNETSFKLQLSVFVAMSIVAWALPVSFGYSSILFISLLIPIMAEIANSSIERVVDLLTSSYHLDAKQAKDAGAALALFSIIVTGLIWTATLIVAFDLI